MRYVEGAVKVLEGLRPGVVAISWHFGHWASGSRDMSVDGNVVKGNPKRSRGFTPNRLCWRTRSRAMSVLRTNRR